MVAASAAAAAVRGERRVGVTIRVTHDSLARAATVAATAVAAAEAATTA